MLNLVNFNQQTIETTTTMLNNIYFRVSICAYKSPLKAPVDGGLPTQRSNYQIIAAQHWGHVCNYARPRYVFIKPRLAEYNTFCLWQYFIQGGGGESF